MCVKSSTVIRVEVGRSLHIPCIFKVEPTDSAVKSVSLNGNELRVIFRFGAKATRKMGLSTDLDKMGKRTDLEAILTSVLHMCKTLGHL